MSATMARQGGRVQLDQSDMRLALNMAKMAKEGFSRVSIKQTQQLSKKPRADVREQKKRGVVVPRHNKLKAAMERHQVMVLENQTDVCLPCQNGAAKNPQTGWRGKGMGEPRPQPAPQRPGRRPAPPDDSERTQCFESDGVPPGYV